MDNPSHYQVLARKYRPETFADLVGQDAMVRTLKNAFEADRIAHAFVMTGIRGTGKTTTARIIAKGMNCIGPDGKGSPTIKPCGQCEHCTQIMAGRHVDVLEMDAASNTSVNDIREIIDGVHYAAASARFKVYIIDEVHMLSTSAFNALLKTLEEPPRHVKFIFATTEIRKVPITVLSRCQRFDLRRIESEAMLALLRKIADQEGAEIGDDALALIVRAAEGSARDATSLLDQAIAHGAGETSADQVRAMIGLADRGRVMDLFDCIMRGDPAKALTELGSQYNDGADPLMVLRDLADVTHWVSVVKITPERADDPTISPQQRKRGLDAAGKLPIRILSRMWQMLAKALEEVSFAPNPIMAAEMAIIRLAHVSDLPSPDELIKKLQSSPNPSSAPPPPAGAAGVQTGGSAMPGPDGGGQNIAQSDPSGGDAPRMMAQGGAQSLQAQAPDALIHYQRFEQVVDLIKHQRDQKLLYDVEHYIRLADYAPGRIEFTPTADAPSDFAQVLARRLQAWTGVRWGVSIVNDARSATLAEQRNAQRDDLHMQVLSHPSVQAVMEQFPGASVHSVAAPSSQSDGQDMAQIGLNDEQWDPFEEE